jgi:CheY-like chemotaxis protein
VKRRRHNLTILVVDDEPAIQELLRHFLEEKGCYVETASSVGDAIYILERDIINAVVLDVRMPGRSGLELLEFMRLDEGLRDIPVVILTGATLTPAEEAIIARDKADVLYKSEDLDQLVSHLDRLTR